MENQSVRFKQRLYKRIRWYLLLRAKRSYLVLKISIKNLQKNKKLCSRQPAPQPQIWPWIWILTCNNPRFRCTKESKKTQLDNSTGARKPTRQIKISPLIESMIPLRWKEVQAKRNSIRKIKAVMQTVLSSSLGNWQNKNRHPRSEHKALLLLKWRKSKYRNQWLIKLMEEARTLNHSISL